MFDGGHFDLFFVVDVVVSVTRLYICTCSVFHDMMTVSTFDVVVVVLLLLLSVLLLTLFLWISGSNTGNIIMVLIRARSLTTLAQTIDAVSISSSIFLIRDYAAAGRTHV